MKFIVRSLCKVERVPEVGRKSHPLLLLCTCGAGHASFHCLRARTRESWTMAWSLPSKNGFSPDTPSHFLRKYKVSTCFLIPFPILSRLYILLWTTKQPTPSCPMRNYMYKNTFFFTQCKSQVHYLGKITLGKERLLCIIFVRRKKERTRCPEAIRTRITFAYCRFFPSNVILRFSSILFDFSQKNL